MKFLLILENKQCFLIVFNIDSMLLACYHDFMANLQVKNIPEKLHNRIRLIAKKQNRTLSDFILQAVKRELSRNEWQERFSKRPETNLGVSAASLLEQTREERTDNFK